MILLEHFIYALFNDLGYQLVKSPKVDALVNDMNLNYLCHIGDNIHHETVIHSHLSSEDLLAISYVKPVKDKYMRQGIYNHTLLCKTSDYIKLNPPTMFERYLTKNLVSPPTNPLRPIEVK